MSSLFDQKTREAIAVRIKKITTDSQAQWGELTAPLLFPHLIDAFQVTFKEKETSIQPGFMSTQFGRWLILRLPIPKGKIKAPPIFHETKPGDFEEDRNTVLAYLERFANGPDQEWGVSPLFGHMSPQQWARLNLTHLKHHLTQFGV